MARHSRVLNLLGLALGFALSTPAAAQDYPSRPIRVITNVSAGGTGDIMTRVIGEQVQKRIGQPFVVEPRPGGNAMIAGRACAEAAPDGYTVCVLSGETLSSNDFLFKKVPYDSQTAFAPITNMFFNTQALVVNASLNVKTLDELIAYAKANPGKLNYLAPSLSHYMFFEYLNKKHGLDLVRVPFRGGAEATNAMLSGATPLSFFGLANFRSFIENGTMFALATDGAERPKLFPQIPTLSELGYREPMLRQYFAMVAPAKTPQNVINMLQKEIAAAIAEPAFRQQQFVERSLEPVANSTADFVQYLKDERVAAERIIKEAGIELQ